MRKLCLGLGLSLSLLPACHAGPATAAPAAILPLRTLRLYETGVGYFERSGEISQSESTALPVPAGHLDDALKTLVVLGEPGKAVVSGLEFGSSVSKGMARALAGLPLEADSPITYQDLLTSLKGAAVHVQARGGSFTGRIVDVLASPIEEEARPAAKDGKSRDGATPAKADQSAHLTVLLLTDRSEIRRLPASQILSVRPTDPAFSARLDSALDALSLRGAQTRRMLRLLARTSGRVSLGYIAETPLWRTTYRLVMGPDGKSGVLQGWALIHNDADEDWRAVQVNLVNGRPDSFLFPLAAPRYTRRELVHPENELSTVPQLLDTTVDAIWGDHIGDAIGVGGLGTIGYGSGGGGAGYGSVVGGMAGKTMGKDSASSLLDVGNLATIAQASGVEAGALFTYTLAQPLDLRAHGSALVPFLQQAIEAEAITWIDGDGPRTGVRLVNSTKQTLPAGPIAFYMDGGFAGESALDRLKPGERRFIHHGADLDVEFTSREVSSHEEPRRLVYQRGSLVQHFLKHVSSVFEIENRSGRARSIYRALHINKNAKVTGADRLDYDMAQGLPVAVFQISPRQRVERPMTTVEGLSHSHTAAELTSRALLGLSASTTLPAADRAVAQEAAARQKEREDALADQNKTKEDIAKVEEDVKRWREHLKALGGDKGQGAGQNPFVKRILDAEDRLAALRKRMESLEGTSQKRLDAVQAVLARLQG